MRELRLEALDELCRQTCGRPASETRLRATWCTMKHALLAAYHAYEAAMITGSEALLEISAQLWELAREAFKAGTEGNA